MNSKHSQLLSLTALQDLALRPMLCGVMSLSLCLAAASLAASADLTFSGTGMNPGENNSLSANAVFSLTGSTLTLSLVNTDATGVRVPTDVLTGVVFKSNGTLTAISATVLSGSTVFNNSTTGTVVNSNTNVGNGWGYSNAISVRGANQGITATGAFSNVKALDKGNLQGLDYGLVGIGGIASNANGGVLKNGQLLYQNSVVFQFTVANGFTLGSINTLSFQYGTNVNEPNFIGTPGPNPDVATVPEPTPALAAMMFGLVLGGVVLVNRRNAKAV